MTPRYSEQDARAAIAASLSYAEALRRLSMCDRGGSAAILKKWVALWEIPTDHFDPYRRGAEAARGRRTPIEALLVDGSTMGSSKLKERLYDAGLKQPACELCGQGELWRGRRMSLILDHVNGRRHDNRLENLRIVCPNCNATLDTHCGRNKTLEVRRECLRCDMPFRPKRPEQRYCSAACGSRHERKPKPLLHMRRVERPPYEQLRAEVDLLGWSGTGRKYGVSDNAVRKWMRAYERERGDAVDEDRAA